MTPSFTLDKWAQSHGVDDARPDRLAMSNGQCLFTSGELHGLFGTSGSGKTWLAVMWVAQELAQGRSVQWVHTEDPNPRTLVTRLHLLDAAERLNLIRYHPITEAIDTSGVTAIGEFAREPRGQLIVVDSLGDALALAGLDEDRDGDVRTWGRAVARRWTDEYGATVLLIDHSTKADDPKHPSGTKAKRALVTGTMLHVGIRDGHRGFTRDMPGSVAVKVAKDRAGWTKQGDTIAEFVFDGQGFRLNPQKATPPTIDDLLLKYVGEHPGEGVAAVTTGVGKNKPTVSAAIERLVKSGQLVQPLGQPRGKKPLYLPNVETPSSPDSPTLPKRPGDVPGSVAHHLPQPLLPKGEAGREGRQRTGNRRSDSPEASASEGPKADRLGLGVDFDSGLIGVDVHRPSGSASASDEVGTESGSVGSERLLDVEPLTCTVERCLNEARASTPWQLHLNAKERPCERSRVLRSEYEARRAKLRVAS